MGEMCYDTLVPFQYTKRIKCCRLQPALAECFSLCSVSIDPSQRAERRLFQIRSVSDCGKQHTDIESVTWRDPCGKHHRQWGRSSTTKPVSHAEEQTAPKNIK